ncbi:MAG: OmpH family outer membrane protein [Candidatus Hinthialibacter antarcticus]|jgi:outer membrane protein|nr:OmpH family outer membrane protein [Candidatus Hinthialibacter antarcticus]
MQTRNSILITIFVVFMASALFAAPIANAQTVKIGVIDMLGIFEKSEKMQAITQTVRQTVDNKQKEWEQKKNGLEKQIQDLQVQRDLMPKESYDAKMTELRAQHAQFMEWWRGEEKTLEELKANSLKPFLRELKDIVKSVAVAQGYMLILKKENVLYSDDTLDITEAVITRMNAKN